MAIATTAMCLPVMAQKRSSLWNDTFNAGVSYSTNVLNEKTIDYRGALNFGYRKFLYYGLFVMPEASLYWQKYDCTTERVSSPYPPDFGDQDSKAEKDKLNRVGLGIDALLGIRISMAEKVGIDLMAGPYIGWSFANKEDGFSYDYDNFEVRGRFGVGISVLDKIYVNAFYDVCKKKFIDDNSYHNNRGNIVTVGIGYTF